MLGWPVRLRGLGAKGELAMALAAAGAHLSLGPHGSCTDALLAGPHVGLRTQHCQLQDLSPCEVPKGTAGLVGVCEGSWEQGPCPQRKQALDLVLSPLDPE